MSEITGTEPQHWHRTRDDGRSHHNMTDPRQHGDRETHWSDDEKAYVAHLVAHEALAASVTPLDDDDPFVRAVLDFIAQEATVVEKVRALAVLLRHELAEGTALTDAKSARALKQLLPHMFRSGSYAPVAAAADGVESERRAMTEVSIPEEAAEAAARSLADKIDKSYPVPSFVRDYARDAAGAAAPLTVAAALERLADELPIGRRWSADYQAGRYDARQFFLNQAADLRRASVSRGEEAAT